MIGYYVIYDETVKKWLSEDVNFNMIYVNHLTDAIMFTSKEDAIKYKYNFNINNNDWELLKTEIVASPIEW